MKDNDFYKFRYLDGNGHYITDYVKKEDVTKVLNQMVKSKFRHNFYDMWCKAVDELFENHLEINGVLITFGLEWEKRLKKRFETLLYR